MAQPRAVLKGGKQSLSPGGTKTIDLRFGLDYEDNDQASMLDEMLAAAEEEDDSRRFDNGDYGMDSPPKAVRSSPGGASRAVDQKPSELAAKYGVDMMAAGEFSNTKYHHK
jgi:hypothetical protein